MLNRRLLMDPRLYRRVRVPRVVCWSAALASGWLAVESFMAFPNAPGFVMGVMGLLMAVALVLESGRELDSSPRAFQTFWVLLSAIVGPIVITSVLLALISLVDRGSDAPLMAYVWWVTVHLPFVAFLWQTPSAPIALLTIVQWTTIIVFAARLTQRWRVYEAVAFTVATILLVGI